MDQNRGVPDGTDNTDDDDAQQTQKHQHQQLSSDNNSSSATTTSQEASSSLFSTSNQSSTRMNNWKPNDFYLMNLISMGFGSLMAKKALYYTNNESTEAAIEWIFTNSSESESDLPLEIEIEQQQQQKHQTQTEQQQSSSLSNDADNDLYKMVFVVNSELTMGVGKIAAQVAHSALGLHRLLLQHQTKYGESLLCWNEYGETKIVLRGENTNHLIELEHKAIALDLPCYLVHDAGKTQVKSGSTTVLGIFGSNKLIDQITGQLKLY